MNFILKRLSFPVNYFSLHGVVQRPGLLSDQAYNGNVRKDFQFRK
jgi:hypothetical protein